MAERGRPKVEINRESFEKLCGLQCTIQEVAGFFSCSHDTIERWTKETYGKTYGEVFESLRTNGLISLRRNQFKLAEKNTSMAIWLGKQFLGQKDIITFNSLNEDEDDALTKSILASMGNEE